MFGTFEDSKTCQKGSIKLVPFETYFSPLKFTTSLSIVYKKSAWIICDADNLLMKIKLSYPIKEVVKINGGLEISTLHRPVVLLQCMVNHTEMEYTGFMQEVNSSSKL